MNFATSWYAIQDLLQQLFGDIQIFGRLNASIVLLPRVTSYIFGSCGTFVPLSEKTFWNKNNIWSKTVSFLMSIHVPTNYHDDM